MIPAIWYTLNHGQTSHEIHVMVVVASQARNWAASGFPLSPFINISTSQECSIEPENRLVYILAGNYIFKWNKNEGG